ncbi:hypothetical protein BV898_04679 [Hypsibius exemplaris]|uniref:Uncharacterized protein n=1 Tax=Hypsibius exemplaris TaxID=2072580 RepID=A0A1W0X1W3_HYPEX|nr:hypothetical protein BV898_04679 [Hypsibius exemplaris]
MATRKRKNAETPLEMSPASPPAESRPKTSPIFKRRTMSTLTFDKLVALLDSKAVSIPEIWTKMVDRGSATVMFSQMDFLCGGSPKFLKYLRIKWESTPPEPPKPIPSVFVDQQTISETIISAILGRNFVKEVGDVVKLLNYLLACPLTVTPPLPPINTRPGGAETKRAICDPNTVLALDLAPGAEDVTDHSLGSPAASTINSTGDSYVETEACAPVSSNLGNISFVVTGQEATSGVSHTEDKSSSKTRAGRKSTKTETLVTAKIPTEKAIFPRKKAKTFMTDRSPAPRRTPVINRSAFADLSCYYWTKNAPHRTALVKNGEVFIEKEVLVKLQTEFPPVSGDFNSYGWELLRHMLGDYQRIREVRREAGMHFGILRMLGSNVMENVREHVAEVFKNSAFDPAVFKAYIATRFTAVVKRSEVKQSTSLMASVLYNPNYFPSGNASGTATEPYYVTPAPGRTCLSEKHSLYVDSYALAELQRYYGPESSCGASGIVDYSWRILVRLCGGETKFQETVLANRERIKLCGGVAEVFGENILAGLYDHACSLHSSELRKLGSLYTFTYRHMKNRMDGIIKHHEEGHGPTAWKTRGEPEPAIVTLLRAQKYWLQPAIDRTRLRPGHDVFITTSVLTDLNNSWGPDAPEGSIKNYSWELILHMLGGLPVIRQLADLKIFPYAIGSYLEDETLLAICLHVDGVFSLQQSMHPKYLVKFCNDKIRRLRYRPKRNDNRREKNRRRREGLPAD